MNPVLTSNQRVMDNARYVSINDERLEELAQRMAGQELTIPTWDWPPYPGNDVAPSIVIDYFGLMNAINFAFTDFEGKGKYAVTLEDGKPILGSTGKSAALWRAYREGIPIFHGSFLASMTRKDGEHVFRGNFEIPMLDERIDLLNEYGQWLSDNYDNSFSNFIVERDTKAFGENGIVSRLVEEIPAVYEDKHELDGETVYFRKRAQLLVQLLHGRYPGDKIFPVEDVDQLTVPADYVVPRINRHDGVTEYKQELAALVDTEQEIPSGSRMEIEIRAATTVSMDRLMHRINELRAENPEYPQTRVYGAHIDAARWLAGRKIDGAPHHLTRTTDY